MALTERKKEFEKAVLTWVGIKDSHGGWKQTSEFFQMSEKGLFAFVMKNLKEKADSLDLAFSDGKHD